MPWNVLSFTNVFIKLDGKYLMIRRAADKKFYPNCLQPVGGGLEYMEDPCTGAIREAKEETGLDLKNVRLKAMSFHDGLGEYNTQSFYFFADAIGKDYFHDQNEGVLELLSADEIKQDKLTPFMKLVINEMLDENENMFIATFHHKSLNEIESFEVSRC